MPATLSASELAVGLLGTFTSSLKYWCRLLLVAVVWLAAFPIVARNTWRIFFENWEVPDLTEPNLMARLSWDIIEGSCMSVIALGFALGLLGLRDFIVINGLPIMDPIEALDGIADRFEDRDALREQRELRPIDPGREAPLADPRDLLTISSDEDEDEDQDQNQNLELREVQDAEGNDDEILKLDDSVEENHAEGLPLNDNEGFGTDGGGAGEAGAAGATGDWNLAGDGPADDPDGAIQVDEAIDAEFDAQAPRLADASVSIRADFFGAGPCFQSGFYVVINSLMSCHAPRV